MRPQYLRVRNWEKHQHYKDRRPPWIKLLVEMLDDYELTHLTYVTQLLYDRLLLLAARTDNNIPHDPAWIATQTHITQDRVTEGVESLVAMRFLSVADGKRSASKAIARRKQNAMPETEAYTETDTRGRASAKPGQARPPRGSIFAVRTMIENGAIQDHITLNAELEAQGVKGRSAKRLRDALTARIGVADRAS